jgi:hypothetical protein
MYQFIDETDMWKLVDKKHYKGKVNIGEKNTKTIIFNGNNELTFDSLVYLYYIRN